MAKKFTQKETEALIAGIREAYETKLRQLTYRLEGLEGENRSLRASLAELKEREGRVGRAIVQAEGKGEEIRAFYRLSAETEWRTLRLFCDKWRALAARMAGCIPAAEAKAVYRGLPTTSPPSSESGRQPSARRRRGEVRPEGGHRKVRRGRRGDGVQPRRRAQPEGQARSRKAVPQSRADGRVRSFFMVLGIVFLAVLLLDQVSKAVRVRDDRRGAERFRHPRVPAV